MFFVKQASDVMGFAVPEARGKHVKVGIFWFFINF